MRCFNGPLKVLLMLFQVRDLQTDFWSSFSNQESQHRMLGSVSYRKPKKSGMRREKNLSMARRQAAAEWKSSVERYWSRQFTGLSSVDFHEIPLFVRATKVPREKPCTQCILCPLRKELWVISLVDRRHFVRLCAILMDVYHQNLFDSTLHWQTT